MWIVAALGAVILTLIAVGAGNSTQSENADKSRPEAIAPAGEQATEAATDAASPGSTQAAEPSLDMSRRVESDPLAIGAVDAPVVLVEYADFRCPFCGLFARDTMPELLERYVDSGVLRVEWRDMPVFGEESYLAAVAGRAAAEQGLYWEYHAKVFAGAPERGHAELPREKLVSFAEEVGVPDLDRFARDLDSAELRAAVEADVYEGRSLGITSVPAFLVNDEPILGAQPIETFIAAIEQEAAEAR